MAEQTEDLTVYTKVPWTVPGEWGEDPVEYPVGTPVKCATSAIAEAVIRQGLATDTRPEAVEKPPAEQGSLPNTGEPPTPNDTQQAPVKPRRNKE